MNSLFAAIRRSLKTVITVFLAGLLFVSSAVPALAIGTDRSAPTKGEAQLDDIYQKSKDILKSPPPSMEQVQSESEKGSNEVQGDADIDEMYRPENSQGATTAAEQVEKALEKNVLRRDR